MKQPTLSITIDAPEVEYWNCSPHALRFSPDGRHLAVGCGGWYGFGALSLVEIGGEQQTCLRFGRAQEQSLTVSGICFDAEGRRLFASTWASSQKQGPVLEYDVDGSRLQLREQRELPRGRWSTAPTGLCLMPGRLLVRCNTTQLGRVFLSLPCDATPPADAHRAHGRVAVVGEEALTGGGGSLSLGGIRFGVGPYEAHRAAGGLVIGPDHARAVPAPTPRVTAVCAGVDGDAFTGGLGGSILRWQRGDGGGWQVTETLQAEQDTPQGKGATYWGQSIVGLCRLDDGRLFSVDASGTVAEWEGAALRRTWSIPRTGTPRALAAHPDTPRGPLLAVGVKATGEKLRRGYTACFSV